MSYQAIKLARVDRVAIITPQPPGGVKRAEPAIDLRIGPGDYPFGTG